MRGNSRGRRAWTAVVVSTLSLLVACNGSGAGTTTPEPTESTSTPAGASSEPAATVSPVVDPEHATDPPGPFEPPLTLADIMVVGSEPIDPALVRRISRLEGVAATTTISLKQVSIENRLYDIAAVDAADYRQFTEARSAQFQQQWDRLAGGEMASVETLQKRLPLKDGFLALDAAPGAPRIHVGAYAPQVPTVDLVVNEKWGETLGIDQHNALVISTQPTSPQSMQQPIRRLVGDAGSVQMMDVASRLGLDPEAGQSVVLVGTFADAVGVYNYSVVGGRVIPDPAWVREHIVTETVPILGQVTCNKAMMPQLRAALLGVVARGLSDEINPREYAGCYYPRFIAGTTQLSNHAFGLALDLNVPGNQRGTVGEMDRGVVEEFKKWGFSWGGDWSYTDPMHFELNRIVNPG